MMKVVVVHRVQPEISASVRDGVRNSLGRRREGASRAGERMALKRVERNILGRRRLTQVLQRRNIVDICSLRNVSYSQHPNREQFR